MTVVWWQRRWLIGVLGGMAGLGCANQRDPSLAQFPDGAPLPVLRELYRADSPFGEQARMVIYDQRSWAQILIGDPDVDFEREMVVLAGLGPAWPREGRIQIVGVWRHGSRLRVAVEQAYGEFVAPGDPVRSPVHAVVLPRCMLPVERFSSALPSMSTGSRRRGP